MISIHVYLTPKIGHEIDMDLAIQSEWMEVMSKQPGFISAAFVKSFSDGYLQSLKAIKPQSTIEVISFWKSEQKRLQWVAQPIHDKVFEKVINEAESVSYTLQKIEQTWDI